MSGDDQDAFDVQNFIGEFARRHNILLHKDDPLFMQLTLIERILVRAVERVRAAVVAAQDDIAAGAAPAPRDRQNHGQAGRRRRRRACGQRHPCRRRRRGRADEDRGGERVGRGPRPGAGGAVVGGAGVRRGLRRRRRLPRGVVRLALTPRSRLTSRMAREIKSAP